MKQTVVFPDYVVGTTVETNQIAVKFERNLIRTQGLVEFFRTSRKSAKG